MKVIDCHTHCFPNDIAEAAITKLANVYDIEPFFDGTVAGLLACMDETGVDISFNLPVATKPSQVQPINNWVTGIGEPRVVGFGAMHPQFPEPEKEIARMIDLGIPGFKLHPNWQSFRPDDSSVFPIYAAAEGKLAIVFHAGDELGIWPQILATPKAIRKVHDLFPGLKIVAAHMGGYRMWDEVEAHLLGSGVIFDVSACLAEHLPDERLVSMIRAHGAEKILFGSDSPFSRPDSQLERLLSLPLTSDEKERIIWRNASKLLAGGP
jgi:uncharacterized protein